MLKNSLMKAVGLAVVAALARPAGAEPKIVKIDGSSTVYPITEAVAEEFQGRNRDVKITVGISGTGGGFKKFCRGEIDLTGASRPILRKEMDACLEAGVQYVELPVAFDAITVVINPGNAWAETMTVADLKKIWEPSAQGSITKWSQVRAGWPDKPLKLYGPGADSGTFDYFTEAVVGKAKSSRGDYTASEDDNVLVQGVSRDEGALGYFGFAYYQENKDKLKAVKIDGGKGGVGPSNQSVEDGSYQPLSRPVFIYVSRESMKKPEVKAFMEFYLNEGGALAEEVGYVALPSGNYQQALQRLVAGTPGTAFGGKSEVGVSIEELLNRKPKL
ncbi:MAG: PstS family phosphate ABC transporter substrate-binding protein [Elusimicrobiota bacterium]